MQKNRDYGASLEGRKPKKEVVKQWQSRQQRRPDTRRNSEKEGLQKSMQDAFRGATPRLPQVKKAAKPPEVAAAVNSSVIEGTEASRRLCEEISLLSGGTCFLGFSRGKDSVVSWLYLRQFFHTIIPFHCATVPHLSFADESLKYYEDFFQTKIIRCLSGETTECISALVYQPIEDEEKIDKLQLYKYGNTEIVNILRAEYGADYWVAYGMSQTDSIVRRSMRRMVDGTSERLNVFYPCFDWTRAQIMGAIDSAGLKLADDYLIANRSLAGLPNYRHLKRFEEVFLEDFKTLELYFPFIKAALARNEFRIEKMEKKDVKKKSKADNSTAASTG